MKRIMAACVIALAAAVNAFADFELDFHITKSLFYNVEGIEDVNLICFDLFRGNAFLASFPIQGRSLDIGFNATFLSLGYGSYYDKDDKKSETGPLTSYVTFQTDPAARYNLGERDSIYFLPAFALGAIGAGVNFDIGYRRWLICGENYHIGASAGLELGFGHQGFGSNIYLGFVSSFGKRGYEKTVNRQDLAALPKYNKAGAYVFDAKAEKVKAERDIVVTNDTSESNMNFEFYAYDIPKKEWILLGSTVLPTKGSSQRVSYSDMKYHRYFAIVPMHRASRSYKYSFSNEHNDLNVVVK